MLHRPKIIHFWFADHDYHFSSYTARLIGAKLIGNFFFSIEEFERRMPNKNHLKHLDLITASGKKQMEYKADYFPREKTPFGREIIDLRKIEEEFFPTEKIGSLDESRFTISPEYEDCRKIAVRKGIPVKRVYEEALRIAGNLEE